MAYKKKTTTITTPGIPAIALGAAGLIAQSFNSGFFGGGTKTVTKKKKK